MLSEGLEIGEVLTGGNGCRCACCCWRGDAAVCRRFGRGREVIASDVTGSMEENNTGNVN